MAQLGRLLRGDLRLRQLPGQRLELRLLVGEQLRLGIELRALRLHGGAQGLDLRLQCSIVGEYWSRLPDRKAPRRSQRARLFE